MDAYSIHEKHMQGHATATGTSEKPLTWEIRVSPRARTAKLQIKPFGGLEVVIPSRFPRSQIPHLVAKHADWVRRQLDRCKAERSPIELPQEIFLGFDLSRTRILYQDSSQSCLCAANDIVVNATGYHDRIGQLRRWVRNRAWTCFPERLQVLSIRSGLGYRKLSIRSQKSRWGSCSSKGNISLNDQLLFLPREVTDYLMIHELCHTRHMNHSSQYWALVNHHCPDFGEHERVLKQARKFIPEWFLRDLFR